MKLNSKKIYIYVLNILGGTMIKINPKFNQSVKRYFTKNTLRAKYDRNMDAALVSGLATGAQVLRIPQWEPHDIGITAFLGTVYLRNATQALKHLLELQPIRKRAIKIKKASKH